MTSYLPGNHWHMSLDLTCELLLPIQKWRSQASSSLSGSGLYVWETRWLPVIRRMDPTKERESYSGFIPDSASFKLTAPLHIWDQFLQNSFKLNVSNIANKYFLWYVNPFLTTIITHICTQTYPCDICQTVHKIVTGFIHARALINMQNGSSM